MGDSLLTDVEMKCGRIFGIAKSYRASCFAKLLVIFQALLDLVIRLEIDTSKKLEGATWGNGSVDHLQGSLPAG
jgi:hypothetical protein